MEFNINKDKKLIRSLENIKNYCKNQGATCTNCNKILKNICNNDDDMLPCEWRLEEMNKEEILKTMENIKDEIKRLENFIECYENDLEDLEDQYADLEDELEELESEELENE